MMLRVVTGSILYKRYNSNKREVDFLHTKVATMLLTKGFYLVPEATEELSL